MPELLIYDEIVSPAERKLWGIGVDAEGFSEQLKTAGDGDLTVRINSPGGSAWDGLAIYNQLNAERSKGRKVTVMIDGIALSAASVIAMGGSEVRAAQASEMMIHNPTLFTWGDADDMRKAAERLEVSKAAAVAAYKQKTSLSDETISALMTAETWLTPEKAKDLRFVDVIEAPPARDEARAAVPAWTLRPLQHPAARAAVERMRARTPLAAPAAPAQGQNMLTPNEEIDLMPKAEMLQAQTRATELQTQLSAQAPVMAAVAKLTGKDSAPDQVAELLSLADRVARLPTSEQMHQQERSRIVSELQAKNVSPDRISALEAAADAASDGETQLKVLRAGAAKLQGPRVYVPAGQERVSDPPEFAASITDAEYQIYQAAGAKTREEALVMKKEGLALQKGQPTREEAR